MRILSLNPNPILEIPFLNAGRGPGQFYEDRLLVQEAIVSGLPDGVSAIVATADLQGREWFEDNPWQPFRLLGETLPLRLVEEILPAMGLDGGRTGAFLAGDFYTLPGLEKRGGSGDITAVWEAFGDEFDWVAGVPGNHDMFGSSEDDTLYCPRHVHYLDDARANIDGLQIAGLGGIVGRPSRLHRRSEEDYIARLSSLLQHKTDVLITHTGPNDPVGKQIGSPLIREVVETHGPSLVVRGHAHWNQPLVELAGGVQVLNVDARVVVMRE
jgi:3',5'-cyclic-AMP phosphodiesterase